MNRYLKIAIFPLVLMAGACSSGMDVPDSGNRIELNMPDMAGSFAEGDEIGLYMTVSSEKGTASLSGERYCDNVKFTFVGDRFLSNPQVFFPEDEKAYNDIYVYAPYADGFLQAGSTAAELSLPEDQSAEPVSDFRYASVMDFRPADGQPVLEMKHAYSKINIRIAPGGYYENIEEIPSQRKVSVKGVSLSGSFDMETQSFTCGSEKYDLVPSGEFKADGSYLSGISFMIPPQTVPAEEVFIEIVAGDDVFLLKPAQALEFKAGTENTITVKLNADFAGVILNTDIEVDEWTDGLDFDMDRDEILPPEGNTVKDIDGNEYPIVRIGKQYWMASNLRTTHLNDGTPIFKNEVKTEWRNHLEEATYTAYENDYSAQSLENMGLLYNRYAVETNRLCPEGWHVPSTTDWDILAARLGGEMTETHGWTGIGFSMMSEEGWADGKNGTNESGFNAWPAGQFYCTQDEEGVDRSNYWDKGESARFWSYTAFQGNAFVRSLDITYPNELNRFLSSIESGYSVRCVHDF